VRYKPFIAAATALGLIALAVTTDPGPPPKNMTLILLSGAAGTNSITAVLSNRSPVQIAYGSAPVFVVASRSTGAWKTNVAGGGMTGITLLQPGKASDPVDISGALQPGTTQVALGVSFTAFSWRSRLAWKFPNWRPLAAVASWLFALDRSARFKTEWSPVLEFPANGQDLLLKRGER